MTKFIRKYKYIIIVLAALIIKQIMISNLPIYAISPGMHDDMMMVKMSQNLLSLKWLGEYSQFTLVKGIFFPLFLSINNFIGISYISAQTLLYSISCIIFTYAIKNLFKKKWLLLLIFLILLFNPVSFATNTLLRVYRNGVTLSQVLLIFSSFYKIYEGINTKSKYNILWSLLAGFSLTSLWITREDAIWIIPFVLIISLISFVNCCKNSNKENIFKKSIIILLPIIILFISLKTISFINYKAYGVFTYNELNDSNFTLAMKSIYSIKDSENIEFVSVSRKKLKKLYDISPSLNSIKEYLEPEMDNWATADRNSNDLEVEDGWFFWVLRAATSDAGYYKDAKTANDFYLNIHKEIETFIKEKKIETQKIMPSALMSPWKKGYFNKLINAVKNIFSYTINFDDVSTNINESIDNGSDGIDLFEAMTNNRAIIPITDYNIAGWYVRFDNEDIQIYVEDDNGNKNSIELLDSLDVYEYLTSKNIANKLAKNCRFNINLPNFNKTTIYLTVYSNDKLLDKISVTSISSDNNDKRQYVIDNSAYSQTQINQINMYYKYANRLNKITNCYKKYNKYIFLLFIISYIYMTIKLILNLIKKHYNLVNVWLFVTSMILSYLVLCIGVAYNQIASCNSISYMYLSGTYVLIISFEFISIFKSIELLIGDLNYVKKK